MFRNCGVSGGVGFGGAGPAAILGVGLHPPPGKVTTHNPPSISSFLFGPPPPTKRARPRCLRWFIFKKKKKNRFENEPPSPCALSLYCPLLSGFLFLSSFLFLFFPSQLGFFLLLPPFSLLSLLSCSWLDGQVFDPASLRCLLAAGYLSFLLCPLLVLPEWPNHHLPARRVKTAKFCSRLSATGGSIVVAGVVVVSITGRVVVWYVAAR